MVVPRQWLSTKAGAGASVGGVGVTLHRRVVSVSDVLSPCRPTRISQPEDTRQPNNVIRQPLGPDGSQGFKQRR